MTVYGQGSLEGRTNTQAACYGYNGEYTHGSLGLQYLRARYLKVETGTFTSRDTYAGRVRDILSQNRYTYAENNSVTFADLSGHKTIGAIIGNAFKGIGGTGKNVSTGKNTKGGMGAHAGNVAQSGAKSAGNIANTVKNTAGNTGSQNQSPMVTIITNKVTAQTTGGFKRGVFNGTGAMQNMGNRSVNKEQNWVKNAWDIALKGKNAVASTVDYVDGKPWIESISVWIEQQTCAAFDY